MAKSSRLKTSRMMCCSSKSSRAMNIKARRSRVEQQGENMRVRSRRNEEYHGKVQQGEVEEPLGKE